MEKIKPNNLSSERMCDLSPTGFPQIILLTFASEAQVSSSHVLKSAFLSLKHTFVTNKVAVGTIDVKHRPDNGPGLTVEQQASVFDRFWRSDEARSREQGGSGLGLAIAKGIIEAHDGTIGVESQPGQGATFWFSLNTHETPESR